MTQRSSETKLRFGSQPLRTLYLGELRMLLRDRRTIIASVILPLLFLPLVFWLSSFAEKKREERIETQTFQYAVVGSEAATVRNLLARIGASDSDEELSTTRARVQLEEAEASDLSDAEEKLANRDVHVIVEALSAEEARAESEAGEEARAGNPEVPLELPLFRIVFEGDWDYSQTAADAIRARLYDGRRLTREQLLDEAGFPIPPKEVVPVVEARDLATAGQRGGRALGRFAVSALLLFLITGGSIVAADTIAGEKERGTLETLLTTAATRTEIVFAKLAVIITVGLVISVIQVLNLMIYVGLELIELPENFALQVSPVSAGWILLLMVPLSVLVAAALLWTSGRAKTYKEFQVSFFPVFVLLLVPTTASILPAIDLRSAIVLVPIANVAVAVRELLVGETDWLFLALTFVVSSAAAWQLVRWTLSTLQTERLVTGTELDEAVFEGGPGLFQRHVIAWFGIFWVTMFLVSNVSWMQDMQRQVLFNVVFLFGLGSLLLAWRYKLVPKEVFALRAPHPWVWPAVLLGAPATVLSSMAVVKLSNYIFPVPERLLEAFGQQIAPVEMPSWQLFLLIAVAPGICEELAFRGALLHGLRKRYEPWQLVLVTAAIFGLFHMSLFRILPTATLGAVLAVVTLLTGSIYPAMLWHLLNNAFAIAMGREGVDIMSLDPMVYAAAGVVTVLVFGILWRTRRVYPDLKGAALREAKARSGT
ncbi:MAG: ABC transporter permease subunit [Thermoanaerobaculia bacterium]|nr:ABC transporter permease subunit [Thermoanaerobaculia bacterium]